MFNTLEKMLETRFKKFWKGNEPTIIEPEKYKRRFKKAIKKYFVAMCIQNEKAVESLDETQGDLIREIDDEEDEEKAQSEIESTLIEHI